ncbi:hypothetical protein [Paenibacillus brasilensis]|uniref:ABC-type enterochelin transport system substrate-binding protein n=1 Tax=Paenibacillus brasilensis TaxID=128574 RepID=A0ABU0L2W6_9BACL|nr:hypothetical protein [Paenibacillus brasilensis]MDQ0494952.1 ABC-type enterochelin transport system substrate-binding protein [Paenibacillus brasilensis]
MNPKLKIGILAAAALVLIAAFVFIVYLDPNYWYLSGNGLESVSEMIKEIDAALK